MPKAPTALSFRPKCWFPFKYLDNGRKISLHLPRTVRDQVLFWVSWLGLSCTLKPSHISVEKHSDCHQRGLSFLPEVDNCVSSRLTLISNLASRSFNQSAINTDYRERWRFLIQLWDGVCLGPPYLSRPSSCHSPGGPVLQEKPWYSQSCPDHFFLDGSPPAVCSESRLLANLLPFCSWRPPASILTSSSIPFWAVYFPPRAMLRKASPLWPPM